MAYTMSRFSPLSVDQVRAYSAAHGFSAGSAYTNRDTLDSRQDGEQIKDVRTTVCKAPQSRGFLFSGLEISAACSSCSLFDAQLLEPIQRLVPQTLRRRAEIPHMTDSAQALCLRVERARLVGRIHIGGHEGIA